MKHTIIIGTILLSTYVAACGGSAKNLAVDWNDHRTIRTCAGQGTGYTGPGDPICTGYMRKSDVVGAVTDVHYLTVQIERVYFRNLPEWTNDAEVAVEVWIKGLLPDNQVYREILDIVNVKKHSFLQIQNKSLNFPVRYRNRTISIGFTITELDDSKEARKWFERGKKATEALRASSWLAGAFGTGLYYEIASEVADRVFEYANSNDHVFTLKQVDFLPALSVTGLQEQLLLTEGRYIVVAVPPTNAYEALRESAENFPEKVDTGFLMRETYYEGGYLKYKATGSEYTFTPYVVLNFVVGKRYFDENPIMEDIKEANRLIQFGKPADAAAMLDAAEAKYTMPATISPKAVLQEAGVVPKGKDKGLLDVKPKDLIAGAIQVVRGQDPKKVLITKLRGMGLIGETVSRLMGGKPAPKAAPKPAPAASGPSAIGIKVERMYTDLEYTYFSDLLKAMRARLALIQDAQAAGSGAKGGEAAAVDPERIVKVLRLFRKAIDHTKDLPRSPAECQIFKLSMEDLYEKLLESYGLSPDDEITDGNRMDLVARLQKKGKVPEGETADSVYDLLLKQRRFMDDTVKACLPAGLKAY